MIHKPIFISLSPNLEKDDSWLVLKLIFQPRKWKRGLAGRFLEKGFEQYLNSSPASADSRPWRAFAFNSGRSAFLAILQALDLPKGSEVLLQGFTCNAAVNPILWSGLQPVFVDIEKETLNLAPNDLEQKIGPKSRAVLIQHTFGLPAKINEILGTCQKHNLILIEDCAHSLGAVYNGKKIGTFGQAAFFSLGRDKVISSVYGGIAVANDAVLAEKVKVFQEKCSVPSNCWILQQLWQPVLTKILVMPLYGFFGMGKYVLIFLQKLRIISKAVSKIEKQGRQPKYLPGLMPNVLAILALNQLRKLDKFNQHRQKIADFYYQNLRELGLTLPLRTEGRIFMRYPILVERHQSNEILKFFRKRKIFLDDGWRKAAVVPPDTNQKKMGYQNGFCPMAEKVADSIVNLPTHINISFNEAKKIVELLNFFCGSRR